MMRRVALKVAYIGTDFHGFQRQPDQRTVEGELISALTDAQLIVNLKNSGYSIAARTDRGVHALGNVISFRTSEEVKINYLNGLLPKNIGILAKAGVPFGFKPRYAKSKRYRYVIPGADHLDFNELVSASKLMEGTHDFSNFSKRSERDPVRTIDSIEIWLEGDNLMMDVSGESFLWKMVRKIANSLFMVGSGELGIEDIEKFLQPATNAAIPPMAPEGLILMDIIYEGIKFKYDEYACRKFYSILEENYIHNATVAAAQMLMMDNLEK